MKNIAIVHDWINGFAGAEQVLLALHEIYPNAPIYTSVWNSRKTPQFKDCQIIPSYLQRIPLLSQKHQLLIPLMPQAFESFDFKGYEVVVSITAGMSKGIITQPDQKHICYCNTPIRYIWNLGGDSRTKGWLRSRIAHNLRIWDVASSERVDEFIGNSHNVAARIDKIYRRSAKIVYPPVNTERFIGAKRQPENYFLSVGRLVGYKRVDLLVAACVKTKQPLKVVGNGPELKKLKHLANSSPWIEFLGRVPDEQLINLYAKAKAFVFTAEEDFGIVPVEAMSAGCPVIAFDKGGATETVKRKVSGEFFEKQTADSLAACLTSFNPDQYDPSIIRQHSLNFAKEVFQEKMRQIIEA